MKKTKQLALTLFVLSHLGLLFMFLLEDQLQESDFPYFFILWGLGILNLGFNVYWADQLNINKWILVGFVISGLVWAFPPLLATYFGIPFLIVYLMIGIFIHSRKKVKLQAG